MSCFFLYLCINACIPIWQIVFQKVELLWGSILTHCLHRYTHPTHLHPHKRTLFFLLSHLSFDRVFSSFVGSLSSQADGDHSEWKQILSLFGSPSILQSLGPAHMGLRFLSTDWAMPARQPVTSSPIYSAHMSCLTAVLFNLLSNNGARITIQEGKTNGGAQLFPLLIYLCPHEWSRYVHTLQNPAGCPCCPTSLPPCVAPLREHAAIAVECSFPLISPHLTSLLYLK